MEYRFNHLFVKIKQGRIQGTPKDHKEGNKNWHACVQIQSVLVVNDTRITLFNSNRYHLGAFPRAPKGCQIVNRVARVEYYNYAWFNSISSTIRQTT